MSIRFQNPATPLMDAIADFHNDVQFYLIVILVFVGWFLFSIVSTFGFSQVVLNSSDEDEAGAKALTAREQVLLSRNITHYTSIEIIWTTIPVFILIAIAIPSFSLLFALDYQPRLPGLTVKIIGHQWYWSYELSNYTGRKGKTVDISFDSYMVPESDLEFGRPRLLTVDRQLILPANTNIRLLVTSTDVIHSWAVPAFGIKIDCIPGRLNQASLFLTREGTFYGQCSELCGVNHGFMPIEVTVISPKEWMSFFHSYSQKSSYDLFATVDKVRENGDKLPLLRQGNPQVPWSYDLSFDYLPTFMKKMYVIEYFKGGPIGKWFFRKHNDEFFRALYPHEYFEGQSDFLELDFENSSEALDPEQKVGSWIKESKSPDFDLAMHIYRDNAKTWLVASYLNSLVPFLYKNFGRFEYAKAGWGYFPWYYGTNTIQNWTLAKKTEGLYAEQVEYHAVLSLKNYISSHSIEPILALREPHRFMASEEAIASAAAQLGLDHYNTYNIFYKLSVMLYVSLSQTGSDKPGLKPASTIDSTSKIYDEIVQSDEDSKKAKALVAQEEALLRAEKEAEYKRKRLDLFMLFPFLEKKDDLTHDANSPGMTVSEEEVSSTPDSEDKDKNKSAKGKYKIPTMDEVNKMFRDLYPGFHSYNKIVNQQNAGQLLKRATDSLEDVNGVCLKKQNGVSVFFYESPLGPYTILQVWLVVENDRIRGAFKRLYDFRTPRATLETCKREGIGMTAQVYALGTPSHRTTLGESIKVETLYWGYDVAKTALFVGVVIGGVVAAVSAYL